MKIHLTATLLFIFSVIVFSCSHKENNKESSIAPDKTPQKLSICFDGSLGFRRTFADIMFMDDEKEIDKYMEEQEKSNPVLLDLENHYLKKYFEKIVVVRENDLLLSKFKYSTETESDCDRELANRVGSYSRRHCSGVLLCQYPR